MTDERQLEQFGEAVEQKKEEAKRRSEATGAPEAPAGESLPDEQDPLVEQGRTQDVRDVRAKNAGHGKKTADKWNQ
jgi:hypothetical protein